MFHAAFPNGDEIVYVIFKQGYIKDHAREEKGYFMQMYGFLTVFSVSEWVKTDPLILKLTHEKRLCIPPTDVS